MQRTRSGNQKSPAVSKRPGRHNSHERPKSPPTSSGYSPSKPEKPLPTFHQSEATEKSKAQSHRVWGHVRVVLAVVGVLVLFSQASSSNNLKGTIEEASSGENLKKPKTNPRGLFVSLTDADKEWIDGGKGKMEATPPKKKEDERVNAMESAKLKAEAEAETAKTKVVKLESEKRKLEEAKTKLEADKAKALADQSAAAEKVAKEIAELKEKLVAQEKAAKEAEEAKKQAELAKKEAEETAAQATKKAEEAKWQADEFAEAAKKQAEEAGVAKNKQEAAEKSKAEEEEEKSKTEEEEKSKAEEEDKSKVEEEEEKSKAEEEEEVPADKSKPEEDGETVAEKPKPEEVETEEEQKRMAAREERLKKKQAEASGRKKKKAQAITTESSKQAEANSKAEEEEADAKSKAEEEEAKPLDKKAALKEKIKKKKEAAAAKKKEEEEATKKLEEERKAAREEKKGEEEAKKAADEEEAKAKTTEEKETEKKAEEEKKKEEEEKKAAAKGGIRGFMNSITGAEEEKKLPQVPKGPKLKPDTIRTFGCARNETPFVFVHIGKAGGGNVRARLAAAALEYKRSSWYRTQEDSTYYYPAIDADGQMHKAKFVSSKMTNWVPKNFTDIESEFKYEGFGPCAATTPLGQALACPFPHDFPTCNYTNGNRCDLVYMGHNLLGNELHWLPTDYLVDWWKSTSWGKKNDDFIKYMIADRFNGGGGEYGEWKQHVKPRRMMKYQMPEIECPPGPLRYRQHKLSYNKCAAPKEPWLDEVTKKTTGGDALIYGAKVISTMPVTRVVVLRDPFEWLMSKFFWHGIHPGKDGKMVSPEAGQARNKKVTNKLEKDKKPPPNFVKCDDVDSAAEGWANFRALTHIFYLCGEHCMGGWIKGTLTLEDMERQAAYNLRNSFAVVGLLHKTDEFYDMVTKRVSYMDTALNPEVEGDKHTSGIFGEGKRCKEIYKDIDFQSKMLAKSPALAALYRLYLIGVEVNEFQAKELAECPAPKTTKTKNKNKK